MLALALLMTGPQLAAGAYYLWATRASRRLSGLAGVTFAACLPPLAFLLGWPRLRPWLSGGLSFDPLGGVFDVLIEAFVGAGILSLLSLWLLAALALEWHEGRV